MGGGGCKGTKLAPIIHVQNSPYDKVNKFATKRNITKFTIIFSYVCRILCSFPAVLNLLGYKSSLAPPPPPPGNLGLIFTG